MAESNITVKVFRFDPEKDKESRYDTYQLAIKNGMNVLEVLFKILEEKDNSLSFRFSCRGAVCGSCAMYINGSYCLACQTQVADLRSQNITVGPLPHLPLIKDLVVDMTAFFEKYERIMPYLKPEGADPEKERLQSPKQRKVLDDVIDCILCGCCYSACPVNWTEKDYIGPAALNQLYRFVADTRDSAQRERLRLASDEQGVLRCHTIFNCTEACPKKVDPNYSIQQLKVKTMSNKLKLWSRR